MDRITADIGGGVIATGEAGIMARIIQFNREADRAERQWIAMLRDFYCMAAHPDDAWVKRDRSSVILCYPQFKDRSVLQVGDWIALGWPDGFRIVRVIRVHEWWRGDWEYFFEPLDLGL